MTNERRDQLLFDLKLAFHGADHFTARLLSLMLKADYSNLAKLAKGFPDEAELIEDWKTGKIDPSEVE
jgi:hypothetical protein